MKFLPTLLPVIFTSLLLCGGGQPGARAATANVSVVNFAFSPATTSISPGDAVIWTWNSGLTSHSTTSNSGLWDSSTHPSPFSFTNTFNSSGTFPYHCSLHLTMTASVIVVTNNSPPSISISNPTNGTVFAAPANVTINAGASDSDGSVTNVQFLVGAIVLTNVTASPFTATTNNLAAGSYTLSAVASDNLGAKNTNSVSISVVTPATLALTNTTRTSGTNFQFSFSANVGLSYVIQRSTNLASANWAPVVTNLAASNPVVFIDTGATNKSTFYRVGRMPNP